MAARRVAERWPELVTLPAEIDITNARDVSCQIADAALRPGVRIIVADMIATTFCDCTGVRALLLAHKRAALTGVELRLLRPCHAVTRVLELMGASRVLVICQSLEEAMTL
jgi:anti-sigma B factor antagonist